MATQSMPLDITHVDNRVGKASPTRVYQLLIVELNALLQEVVGLQETRGLIAIVAERVGEIFAMQAKNNDSDEVLSIAAISERIVNLQSSLGAKFRINEIRPTHVILENTRCPFGEGVVNNHALCNFTIGVVGTVTASLNSYAAVSLDGTIAKGDDCCTVKVYFKPSDTPAAVANEFHR